jgi:hypothetical protein
MSKRLELNLNMSFFKEDWAFKIDFSKCKNFEDLFKYLDSVVIEDINVGEQFRKMKRKIYEKTTTYNIFMCKLECKYQSSCFRNNRK